MARSPTRTSSAKRWRRSAKHVVIATKFGSRLQSTADRAGSTAAPDASGQAVEGSLKRLRTDVIDLFYQHRVDPDVPIEEVAGAVKDLIAQARSSTSALARRAPQTIRRAHAVQPITAIQSEYSLWWREPEAEVLPALRGTGDRLRALQPAGQGLPHRQDRRDHGFRRQRQSHQLAALHARGPQGEPSCGRPPGGDRRAEARHCGADRTRLAARAEAMDRPDSRHHQAQPPRREHRRGRDRADARRSCAHRGSRREDHRGRRPLSPAEAERTQR